MTTTEAGFRAAGVSAVTRNLRVRPVAEACSLSSLRTRVYEGRLGSKPLGLATITRDTIVDVRTDAHTALFDATTVDPVRTLHDMASLGLSVDTVAEAVARHNGSAPRVQAGPTSLAVTLPDHYRVIEEVGHGGMGVVFKVDDLEDVELRELAVKTVGPYVRALESRERLNRYIEVETSVLRNMSGVEGVPAYIDSGVHDGFYYLTMEFIRGRTLRRILTERGRLDLPLACLLTRQLAETLVTLHATGDLHLDIKLDNVLLEGPEDRELDQPRTRLIDFAGALISREPDFLPAGVVFGTPGYMAPEQVQGGELTTKTDVFGLGALLYETATGRKLRPQKHTVEMYAAATTGEIPNLDEIPDAIRPLVLRSLAREPEVRPTMPELLDGLARVLGDIWPSASV